MGVFVMLKVSSTEVQNNFGKYLMLAQEQDVIVTRNGQDVARLVGLNDSQNGASIVSEEVLAEGYGLRKATYEEFRELTKDREERYEYIDGEIFLQPSPTISGHRRSFSACLTSFLLMGFAAHL